MLLLKEHNMNIVAKYIRSDVDILVGQRISFRYKNCVSVGRILKTDFNKNFEMAYGTIVIEEPNITFTVGIERIDILALDKVNDEV